MGDSILFDDVSILNDVLQYATNRDYIIIGNFKGIVCFNVETCALQHAKWLWWFCLFTTSINYNSIIANLFVFKQGSKLKWTYFGGETLFLIFCPHLAFDESAELDLRSTKQFCVRVRGNNKVSVVHWWHTGVWFVVGEKYFSLNFNSRLNCVQIWGLEKTF